MTRRSKVVIAVVVALVVVSVIAHAATLRSGFSEHDALTAT